MNTRMGRSKYAADRKAWIAWLASYGVGRFYDAFVRLAQDARSKCNHCGEPIYLDIVEGGGVPDWKTIDGDYGCVISPDTNDEGTGSHKPHKRASQCEAAMHNGYKNYETWAVNLWLSNEQTSNAYWLEAAREAYDVVDVVPGSCITRTDAAIHILADRLKDHHEAEAPEAQGVYSDLLNAALSEVDWREIATWLLEDIAPKPEWEKAYRESQNP